VTGLGIVLVLVLVEVSLMDKDVVKVLIELMLKGYIVGFDQEPEGGKVRAYVRSREDVRLYNLRHKIGEYEIEYVEVGDIRFLSSYVENRRKFRPVRPGVSVGLWGWDTGTLTGIFRDGRGNVYLASNAHVFVKDPTLCPYEVRDPGIIQPGVHDGGTLDDVVGSYAWHQPIVTVEKPFSCCRGSRWDARVLNMVSELLGSPVNFVDFAVARPVVEFDTVPVGLEGLRSYDFVGVGFAGSPLASAVVNVYNIMKYGYEPVGFKPVNRGVNRGDSVVKTGRTTGVTSGVVISPSMVLRVNLGGDVAVFVDVILTTKLLEPGDSGSPVFSYS
jgi:hypothetical protein